MNYPTIVDGIDFKELVFITNNDPVTDSFMVAKAFRKRHDNVVRDVERTIAACPEEFDTKLNFEVCYKNNELQNGKPQKFYRLRKDGVMLLVMSYTKKEAMRIKIAYINAFNWMYALLQVSEGNTNISGVTVVFRAGEQEQTPPEGFESSGSETVLGTEVKYDTPITRTITSANIDRLRFTFGVQALVETTSKGDRNSRVRLLTTQRLRCWRRQH